MPVEDHRKVAAQLRELLELAEGEPGVELAVQWILEQFPAAGRRGAYSQRRVDRILREEIGAPDGK